jgi:hypothetical protein
VGAPLSASEDRPRPLDRVEPPGVLSRSERLMWTLWRLNSRLPESARVRRASELAAEVSRDVSPTVGGDGRR